MDDCNGIESTILSTYTSMHRSIGVWTNWTIRYSILPLCVVNLMHSGIFFLLSSLSPVFGLATVLYFQKRMADSRNRQPKHAYIVCQLLYSELWIGCNEHVIGCVGSVTHKCSAYSIICSILKAFVWHVVHWRIC